MSALLDFVRKAGKRSLKPSLLLYTALLETVLPDRDAYADRGSMYSILYPLIIKQAVLEMKFTQY